MANPPLILSQYFLTVLEEDTELNGTVVPKGTTVLFAPQTTAHSVRVPGGKSLYEAWGELSKVGHEHLDYLNLVADYQNEQIKSSDRITRLEFWAVENGYKPEKYGEWGKDINGLSLYEYNYTNMVKK